MTTTPDTLFEEAERLEAVAAKATWKPYPEYRDSGVEWLGPMPRHWDIRRMLFLTSINPTKSEVRRLAPDTEVSFVPMEAVQEFGGLALDTTKPIEDVLQGYTYFRDGDIVVAKITPCFENGKGSIASDLVNGIGFGTTELHVIRRADELDTKYLFYLTLSHAFRHLGAAEMYGAGGQKRVPDSFLRDFRTPIPSSIEQQAIAAFLDRKTREIDELIEKKRRLIELLQEQRTALISHAVTKGLNPDAPMKPSGVDWLGGVPKHWEAKRIKHLLHEMVDTEHKTVPFYPDGEYLVVRTSNVRHGQLVMDGAKFTDEQGFKEWTRRGKPKPGDILFTREAPAGEACAVPTDRQICIGQRMVLFRVRAELLDDRFGVYSIYSGIAHAFIAGMSQGSTVAHFNMREIGNIPMLVPPIDEQQELSSHLDLIASDFGRLTETIERATGQLIEYRQALISAAVTGKIDVREVVT